MEGLVLGLWAFLMLVLQKEKEKDLVWLDCWLYSYVDCLRRLVSSEADGQLRQRDKVA